MNTIEKYKRFYLFANLLLILLFAISLFALVYDNPFTVWADEIVSLDFCKGSFSGIITTYANDNYPPLEGFLRKISAYFFRDSVFSMKIFSVVPTILMMFFMLFFLRKEFSDKVATIFLLAICASPAIVHYSIEIRMYTWALFFISMLVPTGWYIIKTGKLRWWLLFLISALCAAYTHYYSMLNAVIIYCFLLSYFLLKKDKKQIKTAIFVAFLGVVVYFPWISILLRRFTENSKIFWIPPIDIGTIKWFLEFPFSQGYGGYHSVYNVVASKVYICLFSCSIVTFFWKEKDKKVWFALCCLISAVLLMLIGVGVSLCTRPLVYDRYLFCSFGLVFFFFADVMGMYKKKIYMLVIILLLLVSVFSFHSKHCKEQGQNIGTLRFMNFLGDNVRSQDIIIFLNPGHEPIVFRHFLPNNKQMMYKDFLTLKESPEVFWIVGGDSVYEGTELYGRFNEDFYSFNIYGSKINK
jgi:hypothetical protein